MAVNVLIVLCELVALGALVVVNLMLAVGVLGAQDFGSDSGLGFS